MANVTDIIAYYANLLIIQYHNKPKAKATIEAVVNEVLASGIIFDIRDGYSVETAVGVQLDIIGKYVGVDRYYTGQVLEGYFSFINYDEVAAPPASRIGFANYSDFDTKDGEFLRYTDILSDDLTLNDDDFRVIIKLKIIQNNSDHSHKSIDDSMFAFFGGDVRPDSLGDMTMFYFVPSVLTAILEVALQKDLLPRPMGVNLLYLIRQRDPFFGFATYSGESPFIEGFANYADYDTKLGEIANYNKLIN